MTTHTKHDHGTFSWTDLSTTDVGAAKKFYSGLFGWTAEDMPMGEGSIYSMQSLGDKHTCAISTLSADMKKMGVPPCWMAYFTVDDVDAATKKVEGAGGKVIKDAFDVMDVGRMSVIQDPTGATLNLWQAKKHIGAGITSEPGAISWAELMTNNVDRAAKFYSTVLGWSAESVQMPKLTYTVFKSGATQAAGMMNMADAPPNWLVYFSVASTDAIVKKVGELGGKVMVPAQDIPNVGRFAVFTDPQGAAFAVLQAAS
jgi:uncharacterized protein